MIRASLKIWNIEINGGQYTKALFDALDIQVRQAARAWLRAIILSGRVPVWTGTARGSLLPLGQYLRVAVPISPIMAVRKGMGPSVGASLGQFQFVRGYYSEFHFTSNVKHYAINELHDPRPLIHLIHEPIPWQSFDLGKKAFRQYIKENLTAKLPRIESYTMRGTVHTSR